MVQCVGWNRMNVAFICSSLHLVSVSLCSLVKTHTLLYRSIQEIGFCYPLKLNDILKSQYFVVKSSLPPVPMCAISSPVSSHLRSSASCSFVACASFCQCVKSVCLAFVSEPCVRSPHLAAAPGFVAHLAPREDRITDTIRSTHRRGTRKNRAGRSGCPPCVDSVVNNIVCDILVASGWQQLQ